MARFNRREFLQYAAAFISAHPFLSVMKDLSLIRTSAAANPEYALINDYKALICIFLGGGNDGTSTLVPIDTASYDTYQKTMSVLAHPRDTLLPLGKESSGKELGLHPELTALQAEFNKGRLAVLSNVGTMSVPLTKQQFLKGSVPTPKQLFSHADQQQQWMTAGEFLNTGWGGRMIESLGAINTNQWLSSITTSPWGQDIYGVGPHTSVFSLNTPTPAAVNIGSTINSYAKDIFKGDHSDPFHKTYKNLTANAIEVGTLVADAFSKMDALPATFGTTGISKQLQIAAKFIGNRDTFGMKRQVFFCSIGGHDTHGGQLAAHKVLMQDLNNSLQAFMQVLDTWGLSNNVTVFTHSDFGRSVTNGTQGTDHGWGNHHFICGGAVKGKKFYGKYPDLTLGGPDDVGTLRLLPSTPMDSYAATLATWFGVSSADLDIILPNLKNFNARNLGFMS